MSDDIRNVHYIIQRNEILNCVLMLQGWPEWNYIDLLLHPVDSVVTGSRG